MKKIIILGMFAILILIVGVKAFSWGSQSDDGVGDDVVVWNTTDSSFIFWGNLSFFNISRPDDTVDYMVFDTFLNYYIYNLTGHIIHTFPSFSNQNLTFDSASSDFIFTEQFNLTEGREGIRSLGGGLIDNDVNLTSDSTNFTKKIASSVIDDLNISLTSRVTSCYYISSPIYTSDTGAFTKTYNENEYNCDNTTFLIDLNITGIETASSSNILYFDSILSNGTIDSPINNTNYPDTSDIDINYTILDDREVRNIWYNIENVTGIILKANSTSNTCGDVICGANFSQQSFPVENQIFLNLYANQSDGQEVLIERVNLSVAIDTSSPDITITDQGTLTSRDVTYTISILDNDVGTANATYEVYRSSDGNSEIGNTTISDPESNTSISFSVGADSTFTFKIEATDSNNNIGFELDEFTVDTSGGVTVVTGGGGSPETVLVCKELNWQIFPRAFDLQLGKNSVRTTTLEIVNNGTEKVDFTAKCDDTSVTNFTKNACNFVNISDAKFSVNPNIKQPFIYKVEVTAPEEAEFRDAFSFGIFFDDKKACKGTVSGLAEITGIRGSLFKLTESREIAGVNIPLVLPVFLIIFITSFIGFLARKTFIFTFPISIVISLGLSFLFLVVA